MNSDGWYGTILLNIFIYGTGMIHYGMKGKGLWKNILTKL